MLQWIKKLARYPKESLKHLSLEHGNWLAQFCKLELHPDPHKTVVHWDEILVALDDARLKLKPLSFSEFKDPSEHKHRVLGICVQGDFSALFLLMQESGDGWLVMVPDSKQPVLKCWNELKEAQFFDIQSTEEYEKEKFGWNWFYKAVIARKRVLQDILLAALVIQLLGLAFPLATQAIVDKVITNQAISTLIALGVGIALFALFNGVMGWLRQKLMLRLANTVDQELATRVISKLFHLPLKFFETRQTGLLVNRIHGVERIREFASGTFVLIALELPFLLVFLALMISYSLTLTGIALGFVTLMVALSFACGPVLRGMANQQFEAGAKVQSFVTERISANETAKCLQQEKGITHRFNELNRKQLSASLNLREFSSVYTNIMQVLEQLMNAGILVAGAYLAMTGTSLTIGMLVAFQMFSQRVTQPLIRLSGVWQELQQIRTAVAQLGDIMQQDSEKYGDEPSLLGKPQGSIVAHGLSFSYSPNSRPVYTDLDFEVNTGEVVLITGPSGCGKSTLGKILLGLYPQYGGSLKLGGKELNTFYVNELREIIGVVPQETVLFAGTILENVCMGFSADPAHVVLACQMAGVHEAIQNQPNGYQTVVGERGVGLSGGQKQRIGVARALLRQPPVLLFDEATASLDNESAESIAQTVNKLRGQVTVLFITHRKPESLVVDKHIKLTSN